MTWRRGMGEDALAALLAAGLDAQQRALVIGLRATSVASTTARILATRDTPHVRVHVQAGGGAFNPAGDVGGLAVLDFRKVKIQDAAVPTSATEQRTLWLIPVQYREGVEYAFDGQAGRPDYMAWEPLSQVEAGDSRLSDARTPLAHAASHVGRGGADRIPATWARVRKGNVQSIPSGAWTALAFNAVQAGSTAGFADLTAFPNGITIATGAGGIYQVNVLATFQANATGVRGVRVVRVSDSVAIQQAMLGALNGYETAVDVSDIFSFGDGSQYRVEVFQDSGAALNTSTGLTANFFSIAYLGTP